MINGLPTSSGGGDKDAPLDISRALLEDLAGSQTIQVERRYHRDETFGQNRTASRQVQLSIKDFLAALLDHKKDDPNCKDNELYYWSTQEDTDDPYNLPCRQLLDGGHIPANAPHAGNLILSSCNLWMGSSEDGASSGLHHDYHDNFYLLLQGTKRFRLFSPDCAPMLHVYGTIDRIHANGRISYIGNETRADGVPLEEIKKEDDCDSVDDGSLKTVEKDEEEEEEVVIGKGFDYVSDDDDQGAEFDEYDQTDDFDEIMGTNAKDSTSIKVDTVDSPPDSFSCINPCDVDQDALFGKFPKYKSCRQVVVELKAGQMLYLPAGFFHEVTSYSSIPASSNISIMKMNAMTRCHMALNYWYHPPDALGQSDFMSPYKDDFWRKAQEEQDSKTRPKI